MEEVPEDQVFKYGVVGKGDAAGDGFRITSMVEKPKIEDAPSNLIISGRYILQPEIMTYLARGESGAGNEIQLTDSMLKLIGQAPFHGLRLSGTRFDCGTKAGFLAAGIAYALRRKDLADEVRERITQLLAE